MRSKRRSAGRIRDRRLLVVGVALIAVFMLTVNGSLDSSRFINTDNLQDGEMAAASLTRPDEPLINPVLESIPITGSNVNFSDQLWAEVTDSITTPKAIAPSTSTISLDVRDADLLDVLSLLAYKLDANIIYLEQPRQITIKTSNLSPITTFQVVLQKEGLDYLLLGRNYIVGQRDRLYSDFANRMLLTRYSLFYVSPEAMQGYLSELGVPVQSLTVDSNQQALWMQGTPMTLGKARELINTLDVMENAAFAEGGARKIRMPVATANGPRAEEELEALIDLLSILLDGFRDGRTDMGWVTWDHPDPIPHIYMDWDNPIIKPYDIKMKITRDFAGDYGNQIRYLIAEGMPANIELVTQMISAIAGTPNSPLSFSDIAEEANDNNNVGGTVQWVPSAQQQSYTPLSYTVSVNAVPNEGGSLSGSGSFTEGSTVTITAVPSEGYEFVRWIESGAQLSVNKSYSFTIYKNRFIEAVFIKIADEDLSDQLADEIIPVD
ncbi:MAG: hypothetical protein K0B84_10170 [Firmicutes bacterium]|nr:hypothetical protein [Bacillota bacterium]